MTTHRLIARQEAEDFDWGSCTIQTCDINDATVRYFPSVAGNGILAGVFGLLLLVQLGQLVKYRTWGFSIGMIGGLVLELVGYIGRIRMNDNPWLEDPFLMQIVTLTIAPAFISAAIYLCLARIVVVYGEGFSRLKPRTYSILFITCDFIALLLQAIGGGMASAGDPGSNTQDIGIDVMLAGLAFQIVSLSLFIGMCSDFAWRAYRHKSEWNPAYTTFRQTRLFKFFLVALAAATLAVFIRSVYRVAELSEGFDSDLANDEVTFMILEGAMIAIAGILLTLAHPGFAFQGHFHEANFTIRTKKNNAGKVSGGATPDEEMQAYPRS